MQLLLVFVVIAPVLKFQHASGLVVFLCSDDASYITGQVIGVNGGMA